MKSQSVACPGRLDISTRTSARRLCKRWPAIGREGTLDAQYGTWLEDIVPHAIIVPIDIPGLREERLEEVEDALHCKFGPFPHLNDGRSTTFLRAIRCSISTNRKGGHSSRCGGAVGIHLYATTRSPPTMSKSSATAFMHAVSVSKVPRYRKFPEITAHNIKLFMSSGSFLVIAARSLPPGSTPAHSKL